MRPTELASSAPALALSSLTCPSFAPRFARSDEIHLLPSLSEKPPPSKDLPDLSTRPEKDVFAPPFVPEELVGDLRDHFVVLNKFCFLPEQFVLLTKRWAVQAEPLEEMDLWIAYKICRAFEEKGKPLLAFLK